MLNCKLSQYKGSLLSANSNRRGGAGNSEALVGVTSVLSNKGRRTINVSLHPRIVDQAQWSQGDRLNLVSLGQGAFVLESNEKGNKLLGGELSTSMRSPGDRRRYRFYVNIDPDMCPNFQVVGTEVEALPERIAFVIQIPE